MAGGEGTGGGAVHPHAGHVYWNAHVDKANIGSYDYSALLYERTSANDARVPAAALRMAADGFGDRIRWRCDRAGT